MNDLIRFKDLPDSFICLDVETATGSRSSICQIAIAIVENNQITDIISEYVQPPNNEYSDQNINVHGINPSKTKKSKGFDKVWAELKPFIGDKYIVAHSASFDSDCVKKSLEIYGEKPPLNKWICTFEMTGHSLKDACKGYDIPLTNHHSADADTEACASLFIKLKDGVIPKFGYTIKKKDRKEKSQQFFSTSGEKQLKGDILKPDFDNADPNSPFFKKVVVFTGALESISRKDAASLVKQLGGDNNTTISAKVDFVITGSKPGPSKMKKILNLQEKGNNIKIVYEDEFFEMLDYNKE